MKYRLLIYGNTQLWESLPPADMHELVRETDALWSELRGTGEFVGAYGVAEQADAKMVRTPNRIPAITDGPYIESKEYLASFAIVDVASEARALEIAAANPASRYVGVEVRPLMHEAAEDV